MLFAPRWSTLWLIPLALLVGAALSLLLGRDARRSRIVGLAWLGLASVPLFANLAPLLRGESVLDAAPLRLARVGSLDAVIGLTLDARAASLLLAVLCTTLVFVLRRGAAGEVARALGAAAGAALCALADGVPGVFVGLAIAFCVAWGLDGSLSARAQTRSWVWLSAGLPLWFAAAGVVFWALGGQWLDGARYLSDYRARFAVVAAPPKPASTARDPKAVGKLTVISHPGARVYAGVADESQLLRSDPLGTSPMIGVELPAGLHKIAIVPGDGAQVGGDGLEAAMVDAVPIVANKETVIELVGPSLTFREIERQTEDRGFNLRRVGNLRVGDVVAWLMGLGGLLVAAAFFSDRPERRPLSAFVLIGLAALSCRFGAALGVQAPPLYWLAPAFAFVAALAAWRTRSVGAPLAAAIGFAALLAEGRPAIALVAGAAPVWALLSIRTLEPTQAPKPAPVEDEVVTEPPQRKAKKKRKKKEDAERDASVAVAAADPVQAAESWLRFWGLCVIGPLIGFGGLAISAYERSSGEGLVVSLAATVLWSALSFSVARTAHAPATIDRVTQALVVLIATSAAAVVVVKPWSIDAQMGSKLAPIVAALVLAPGTVLFGRERRKARPVEPTHDQEEAAVGASLAARAFALVSALASLPWLVIERLVDRALGTPAVAAAAAPVTKRSPSSEAPRADDASSAEEEGSE